MPSTTADSAHVEELRTELQLVLHSPSFARSPGLGRLLSYLCQKSFAGEDSQIKEYSIALDVFGRPESFDQDSDSIVRVQANRLRKRLAEYYAGEGGNHRIHITIPLGQYVPAFEEQLKPSAKAAQAEPFARPARAGSNIGSPWLKSHSRVSAAFLVLAVSLFILFSARQRGRLRTATQTSMTTTGQAATAMVGLPVGDEIHILAGSSREYVDRAGKLWSPDAYFTGGTAVHSSVQYIWRTQDSTIYRNSRQGDFRYDIPLRPGIYELHLAFAETFYGPEDVGGGGEGSRVMTITANGKSLLSDFDVVADSEGERTADVKVFTDISPAQDGFLHLAVSSANGKGMLSAIEILPGYRGHIRPVRIVARDVPYYSNDSQWWSSDIYFKGGQLYGSETPASGTDDPELYETERWGHFSYAIPVTPGEYTLTLYFIEHGLPATRDSGLRNTADERDQTRSGRIFDVFSNGQTIVRHLHIAEEAGNNRPLIRKIRGLEPNAQGKLRLDFVPISHYATVSAIEVMPE
jgi:hypothetical protein